MKLISYIFVLTGFIAPSFGWLPSSSPQRAFLLPTALQMSRVGIFYGTSTGSTQECAEMIYNALGEDAAEPVDIDAVEGNLASLFSSHESLIVGTPTWNTGADTGRSGTGWDELYYDKLPTLKSVLDGKHVAVFGLGDQISYGENYADATGELFDVFQGLGCKMFGSWSQEGYEHTASKSIRGDKFCGLLLDMENQEDLSEERIEKWVSQLRSEGFLEGSSGSASPSEIGATKHVEDSASVQTMSVLEDLQANSSLLDESIAQHSTGGFVPHRNPVTGKTMWVSPDGRTSFVTTGTAHDSSANVNP